MYPITFVCSLLLLFLSLEAPFWYAKGGNNWYFYVQLWPAVRVEACACVPILRFIEQNHAYALPYKYEEETAYAYVCICACEF